MFVYSAFDEDHVVEADEYEVDEDGDLVFWSLDEDEVDEDGEPMLVEVGRVAADRWDSVFTAEYEDEEADED